MYLDYYLQYMTSKISEEALIQLFYFQYIYLRFEFLLMADTNQGCLKDRLVDTCMYVVYAGN